jgi:glutamate-1-semialdehyde 2,1-aminomutase
MRAVLGEVLTGEALIAMEALATTFAHGLPWSVSQLGARCEYRFMNPAPVNGAESARRADPLLEDYLHLYGVNRGVLLTPFHNMALMWPATTLDQVERHRVVFSEAAGELVG